ncbi:vitamin K-dependent protein S-like [Chanos chanos]|uniref:Vitamin K-dependent protein S-like n=1 Tax=Chanos chanos TaxID=29144 RepID=A0A6J2UP40_CHACN|nr:vitamin K-dependent protein S-like [Chanos chanos]
MAFKLYLAFLMLELGKTVSGATLRQHKDSIRCHTFDDSRSAHLLYMGNSSSGGLPILQYEVSELISFDSEFELRTLDPEGIIFFGDIGGQQNFFLLAVVKGHLSVQTSTGDGGVLISDGPFISDGQWKKIMVKKLEGAVSVSVDGHPGVIVKQSQESQRAEGSNGLLRIVIGNSISGSGALLGLNPMLDGCMRRWDWVKQDSSVLLRTLQESPSQRCWVDIAPGAYFPGNGSVGFSPLMLWNASWLADGSSWRLSVELALRPVSDSGTLFTVVDSDGTRVISLSLHRPTWEIVLHHQAKELSFPPTTCSGGVLVLQLEVGAGQVVMVLNEKPVMMTLKEEDFQELKSVWSQSGSMVYLGGEPDGSSSLHGCMQVKVQGVHVDLDQASSRLGDIHSHSCPASLDIRDGK